MADLDLVLERFIDWTDDRIIDYHSLPIWGTLSQDRHHAYIEMLESSKINLRRIIKEVKEALK